LSSGDAGNLHAHIDQRRLALEVLALGTGVGIIGLIVIILIVILILRIL
jgi:tRNA1(Val) A37 N6-methylase TrmN6